MSQLSHRLRHARRALLPLFVSALASIATATPALAQVATFEGLGNVEIPVPAGYAVPGLAWNNWYNLRADTDVGRGADGCIVSGTNCGYNGFGSMASLTRATPFTFNSGYFMGWYNGFAGGFGGPVSLTVNGYLGAALLGTRTLDLDPTAAQLYTFDYAGVDRVDFITNGNQGSTWYLADDLTFNAAVTVTPEPASVVLLASGLVGVLGMARRRRRLSAM